MRRDGPAASGRRKPPCGPVRTSSLRGFGEGAARRSRDNPQGATGEAGAVGADEAAAEDRRGFEGNGDPRAAPMPPPEPGEEAGLAPALRSLTLKRRHCDLTKRHLGAVGTAGGRGGVARPVHRFGPKQVGARDEVARDGRNQASRVGGPSAEEFGRQLGPVLSAEAAVPDLAARGARVDVGDRRRDRVRERRSGVAVGRRLEGNPRGDVVEPKRNLDRARRGVVAGFIAQPEVERVGAGGRDRAVRERGDVSPGCQLDAGVEPGRPRDPPVGAPDRARRALIGVCPGEIEVVDPAPPVAAGQRGGARVGRRVVVDQDGAGGGAADIPGEVRRAMPEGVGAVAEPGRVDRRRARDQGQARLHPGAAPLTADLHLLAEVLGQVDPTAVDRRFAEPDPGAAVVAPEPEALDTAAPAPGGQLAADPGSGKAVVFDRDRQRPDRRPRGRFEAAPLCFGAGAEQPVLDRGRRWREAGDEAPRVGVGDARGRERREPGRGHDADPLLDPVVKRLPPGAGDPGDPGSRRRVPAPTGETGAGDRPRGQGEALDVDTGEGVGSGGDRTEGVGAELGAAGGVGPPGVDPHVPAALGDRVLARLGLTREEEQQGEGEGQPKPDDLHHSDPRSRHPASSDDLCSGDQGRGAEISPPAPPLREWGRWHFRPRTRSPRACGP